MRNGWRKSHCAVLVFPVFDGHSLPLVPVVVIPVSGGQSPPLIPVSHL